ncbi:MAG: hypothetical protein GY847_03880 [Proteobacteria bacterium]|nr:hypothetical protein [Pseudomonadota bacterium]
MKIPGRVRCVEITQRAEADPGEENAFLRLERLHVVNTYSDGIKSPTYSYDSVLRKHIDAVVLLLTAEVEGSSMVCLRSCVRPPLLLRRELEVSVPDEKPLYTLWELPAGLIEKDESGLEGIRKRASIEALEETGYQIAAADFLILSGAPFASPGIIPERLHFALANIENIFLRDAPTGDGSIPEEGGGIWWIALDDALTRYESGELVFDLKTELGLRRLEAVQSHSQESPK